MKILLIGLSVVASGLGFTVPILAKVFKYDFMTKVDVGFYTFGTVLVLAGGGMVFFGAKRLLKA